jgi:hypothetical protein
MEEISKLRSLPTDFLSPETKETKEYSLNWAEALEKIGLNSNQNGFFPGFVPETQINKFAIWTAYARANQPIDKYKPILGVSDKRTRKDPGATSYRALNWENIDIASKYVNILIGKLLKQNNDIGINAIDKRAQDARRKKEIELQDEVINGAFYDSITAKTGINFERPTQDDVIPPPSNMGEINMFMGMFYKEDYCLVVQDLLRAINESDNYNYILSEVARDLVERGTAATKTYRIGNKILRRRCDVMRMGISSSTKANFEDVKYIWEDWDLTIGQLKEVAGAQFTEDEYRTIAEQAGNVKFDEYNINDYYKQNMCYPWDNTKITVKDCVWFSPNWITEQVATNSFGNVEVQQKEYDWWKKLESKGVTVESFNKANESKVVRYCLDDQYQCLWIKGTKFVANFGKSKDMLKNASSLGKTVGPYCVYQLKKCIMESIIPTLDNIQIQWLQFQHHAAKSVPAGQAIEFTALQDINIEGAGGTKLSPREALQIYFDTGILLWRRRDASGNLSNFKPIEELAGGISNAMEKHFSFMIQDINLLRGQIGLNELTDASTPNSEMGKAVAGMASEGTDDALRPLHFGFDEINKGTHQRTVMHITGMARTGMAPEYTEAVGLRGMALIGLLSDLTDHELGCYLMKQPTEEMNQWIAKYCDSGIKAGSLLEEEAFEIQMEPNVYRRIRLLKMYRQQKQKQAMDMEAQKAQIKSQNDTATAQAAAQAQQEAQQAMDDSKINYEWEKAKATVWAKKQTIADEAFLLNLQSKNARNEAYTQAEQDRVTKMMEIDAQGQWNLLIAKSKPKPSASGKK